MITEAEFRALAAQGLQPHTARPRVVRGPRHAAVALPQARQPALHASCSNRSSAASASAATRSSACPRRSRIRVAGTHVEVEDRRRRRSSATTAIRSLSSRDFMRRFRAAPRAGAAALLRRARRLFRLRHGAPHRDRVSPHRAPPAPAARRRSRHAAAADRGARGRRQPRRQDLADRLRRPGDGRTPTATRSERLQALRRKLRAPVDDSVPDRDRTSATARKRDRAPRRTRPRCARAQGIHRRRRHHAGRAVAADGACRSRRRRCRSYRALRSLNPSPYMFYYDFGDFHVVGASPEILVRKEGDGGHAAADRRHAAARRHARGGRALAAELLADPKEIAEHVMLLDLGRNDVGRVAAIGTRAASPSAWRSSATRT